VVFDNEHHLSSFGFKTSQNEQTQLVKVSEIVEGELGYEGEGEFKS